MKRKENRGGRIGGQSDSSCFLRDTPPLPPNHLLTRQNLPISLFTSKPSCCLSLLSLAMNLTARISLSIRTNLPGAARERQQPPQSRAHGAATLIP